LGTTTALGWESSAPDLALVQDSTQKGLWKLENIRLAAGAFKFRYDNDWCGKP
jgi:hypothetical protein